MADALEDPKIQQFIEIQSQQVRFKTLIQQLTDRCWDSCVSSIGNKLGSRTETCIADCVERFLDTSNYVTNRLGTTAQAGNVGSFGGGEMQDD